MSAFTCKQTIVEHARCVAPSTPQDGRERYAAGATMRSAALLFATLLWFACGCASGPVPDQEAAMDGTEASERFHADPVLGARYGTGTSGSFRRSVSVHRRGVDKSALVLVAPISLRAELSGLQGEARFECSSTPVFNIGDGFQMDITLLQDGEARTIYGRYYDSGRRASDRDWIPLSVPIELRPGVPARLEIRISAGPQGDLVGDWLALADLRITGRTAQP